MLLKPLTRMQPLLLHTLLHDLRLVLLLHTHDVRMLMVLLLLLLHLLLMMHGRDVVLLLVLLLQAMGWRDVVARVRRGLVQRVDDAAGRALALLWSGHAGAGGCGAVRRRHCSAGAVLYT